MSQKVIEGDNLATLKTYPDNYFDAVVTDPPYGLSFMGKKWDYDVPRVELWAEVFRVLKPGGHLLAFAGTRTQHRMAVNIEDAGFEIRDLIAWVYGSGFPKSLDISKAIDKTDASEAQQKRRYEFTAWIRSTGITAKQINDLTDTQMGSHYLTDASQPAIMTREHLEKCRVLLGFIPEWVEKMADVRSVESENFSKREIKSSLVMRDTSVVRIAVTASADNYDPSATREVNITAPATDAAKEWDGWGTALKPALEPITVARKPIEQTVAANVLKYGTGGLNIDGARVGTEIIKTNGGDKFPNLYGTFKTIEPTEHNGRWPANLIHDGSEDVLKLFPNENEETAARFFYCPKASKSERDNGLKGFEPKTAGVGALRDGGRESEGRGNFHPTVKPVDLMRYLVKLVTPKGGTVLDPFNGSGTTGVACKLEGFNYVGLEFDPEYCKISRARIENYQWNPAPEPEPTAPNQLNLFE